MSTYKEYTECVSNYGENFYICQEIKSKLNKSIKHDKKKYEDCVNYLGKNNCEKYKSKLYRTLEENKKRDKRMGIKRPFNYKYQV